MVSREEMTIKETIEWIVEMEQSKYNSCRIRQEIGDGLISMIETMLPADNEKIQDKESSYKGLLKMLEGIN